MAQEDARARPMDGGGNLAEKPSRPRYRTVKSLADRPIDVHVNCPGCGYDLFGVRRGGTCPECGEPVRTADASLNLGSIDPHWARRTQRGLQASCAGIAAAFALPLLPLMAPGFPGLLASLLADFAAIVSLAAAVGFVAAGLGMWWVADRAPDPLGRGTRRWRGAARAAGVVAAMTAALGIIAALAAALLARTTSVLGEDEARRIAQICLLCGSAGLALGLIAVQGYLRAMARFLHDYSGAWISWVSTGGLLAALVLTAIFGWAWWEMLHMPKTSSAPWMPTSGFGRLAAFSRCAVLAILLMIAYAVGLSLHVGVMFRLGAALRRATAGPRRQPQRETEAGLSASS